MSITSESRIVLARECAGFGPTRIAKEATSSLILRILLEYSRELLDGFTRDPEGLRGLPASSCAMSSSTSRRRSGSLPDAFSRNVSRSCGGSSGALASFSDEELGRIGRLDAESTSSTDP